MKKYILLYESFKNFLEIKRIIKQIEKEMICDIPSHCIHVAEEFILKLYKKDPILLKYINVIEEYVYFDDLDNKYPHTWIELYNGEKIDPSFKQFYYDDNYSMYKTEPKYYNKILNKYTGEEYYNIIMLDKSFLKKRSIYPNIFYIKKKLSN